MKNTKKLESLQTAWEHALARAAENETRPEPLDAQTVQDTAGLVMKSGVRSGLGRGTHACTLACTAHFYTCSC